jgi:hypothetical protein
MTFADVPSLAYTPWILGLLFLAASIAVPFAVIGSKNRKAFRCMRRHKRAPSLD